jgi:hypothetical protein
MPSWRELHCAKLAPASYFPALSQWLVRIFPSPRHSLAPIPHLMAPTNQLTNLQQELLKLFAQQVSEDDLRNIRTLLGQYFAQRLTRLADQAWDQQGWTEKTMLDWLNEENQ